MSEPAKKVAQQAEARLDRIAKSAREQFNKITESRFTDRIKDGRFADQVDHGVDQGGPTCGATSSAKGAVDRPPDGRCADVRAGFHGGTRPVRVPGMRAGQPMRRFSRTRPPSHQSR